MNPINSTTTKSITRMGLPPSFKKAAVFSVSRNRFDRIILLQLPRIMTAVTQNHYAAHGIDFQATGCYTSLLATHLIEK